MHSQLETELSKGTGGVQTLQAKSEGGISAKARTGAKDLLLESEPCPFRSRQRKAWRGSLCGMNGRWIGNRPSK